MSGVGYTPLARTSIYQLGTLTSPFTRYPMDLSADPGKVGVHPNEFFTNLGDPAVREAFERRYGPGTAGPTFKQWIGPDNEVRFIVADALSWKYGGGTVRPTETEITDVQATGDRVWHEFLIATTDGFSAARPVHISDTSKPHGPVLDDRGHTPISPFWGVPYFEFNDAEQVIEPPAPVDDPPGPVVPPPHVGPPAWQPLPADLLQLIGVSNGWNATAWGPGKIRGVRRAFALLRDYDARQKAATS